MFASGIWIATANDPDADEVDENGRLLVGERPGAVEDREGEPFVGPAGHLLDRAFERQVPPHRTPRPVARHPGCGIARNGGTKLVSR
jgi:uracil-DNA glycosylase